MPAAFDVADASFQPEVLDSKLPLLVDFWADWCPPCKLIAPILEQLAGEFAGRMKVAKLNYDHSPLTAARFQVMSIPTLIVFRGGEPIGRMTGYQPKQVLRQKLEALLAPQAPAAAAAG